MGAEDAKRKLNLVQTAEGQITKYNILLGIIG